MKDLLYISKKSEAHCNGYMCYNFRSYQTLHTFPLSVKIRWPVCPSPQQHESTNHWHNTRAHYSTRLCSYSLMLCTCHLFLRLYLLTESNCKRRIIVTTYSVLYCSYYMYEGWVGLGKQLSQRLYFNYHINNLQNTFILIIYRNYMLCFQLKRVTVQILQTNNRGDSMTGCMKGTGCLWGVLLSDILIWFYDSLAILSYY